MRTIIIYDLTIVNHKTPFSIQIAFTGLPRLKSRFIAVKHGLPRFKWFLYDAKTKLKNLKAIIESYDFFKFNNPKETIPKKQPLSYFEHLKIESSVQPQGSIPVKTWNRCLTTVSTNFYLGKPLLNQFRIENSLLDRNPFKMIVDS